jgi:hypothetical protein
MKTMDGSATRHKRISFRKNKKPITNDYDRTSPAQSHFIDKVGFDLCETKESSSDNNTSEASIQPPDHKRRQFKVKRKSVTTYKSKKRKCSFSSNLLNDMHLEVKSGPSFEPTDNILSSTPQSKPSNGINTRASTRREQRVSFGKLTCPSNSDSMSDFWNDDQLFADFNLSDMTMSKLETSNDHIAETINPLEFKAISKTQTSPPSISSEEKSSKDNLNIMEETFYGLPLGVKQMLLQSRGIDSLYGEYML